MKTNQIRRTVQNNWLVLCVCMLLMLACGDGEEMSTTKNQVVKKALHPAANQALIDSGKRILQNGDIVLRTGNDVISSLFAQLNKTDKTFSHCGIASFENNKWYVYHSIGGEDNPDSKLRRDTFEKFVGREHNLGYGICRYPLTNEQQEKIEETLHTFYKNEIPFDMQFDLKTDNRLYCAEMVFKVFNKALDTTNFFKTTIHNGFEYVSTDNLFVNIQARILCHVVY